MSGILAIFIKSRNDEIHGKVGFVLVTSFQGMKGLDARRDSGATTALRASAIIRMAPPSNSHLPECYEERNTFSSFGA